jgi:CRP-like cAMP-binding protein
MNPVSCQLPDPRQNRLLAAMSEAQLAHWRPWLEYVAMPLGSVLFRAGGTQDHAYFPTTAIVSLVYLTDEGDSTETAVVGNEGVVGISIFMGGDTTPGQAVVQTAGHGYRLRAQLVKNETESIGPILKILLLYTLTMIAQVAQTAACNRYHSIDQLFCRRLVMGLDRLPSGELAMTQELAAGLLGVRREGVTAVAFKLQQDGVIKYRRGHLSVLDRPRLEARTCELDRYSGSHRQFDLSQDRHQRSAAESGCAM